MQAMDWAALKRRGSASICDGVVPSEIACTRLIDSIHAGFDRCLDDFPCLVHNVTTPIENITARIIRTVLPNNERFARLITGSRAFRNHRSDDRSGYLYRFSCSCSLFLIRRTRLGKCQWGNHQAAERENYFLHVRLLLLWFLLPRESLDMASIQQEPLRAFPTAHFSQYW